MEKLAIPVTPVDVTTATDLAGLARLKEGARAQTPEALEAVAKQFESLFLEMMLKSMRDASLGEGIFDSEASELYQGMFDKQVALDMANGKGLGIAELLVRQLSQRAPGGTEPAAAPIATQDTPFTPRLRAPGLPSAATGIKPTPLEFVREILPLARKAATALNVHPAALVAQAALETGWGQRVVAHADGTSSNNLFGIKASPDWTGPRASTRSLEFENGLPIPRQASFRSYGSPAESFADYVSLLKDNPRYREVLEQGRDAGAFADAMGRSGYATDPDYALKIKTVLGSETLRGALAALKIPETASI